MKFKFSIGKKIGLGFGLLLFCTITIFLVTKSTLDSSKKINQHNTEILSPSVDELQELKIQILESKMLIANWANVQTSDEHPQKEVLRKLLRERYPILKGEIEELSKDWTDEEVREANETLFPQISELFSYYDEVMSLLSDFSAYEDPDIKFLVNFKVEEGGDIPEQAKLVIEVLDGLIQSQRQNTKDGSNDMLESFDMLQFLVNNVGIGLFLGGIIIAFLTIRTIVKPVQKFKKLILLLGKGIIPEEKMKPRSDEIGDMAVAFNELVTGVKRTTEFANEIGSGNFETEYKPLSESDELGHSLLTMRKDLHGLTSNLEQKVKERTEEVMRQKKEIEELLTEVTDSIKYAKRIQNAILPPKSYINRVLPNSFVLFKPKDIVSGDFYWVEDKEGKTAVAAVDCTGHGVPGALMTVVGYNKLHEAMSDAKEYTAAAILDGLNLGVINTFSKGNEDSDETDVKDGMDAAMCVVDYKTRTIQFAGAYNPLYIIRSGSQEIEQIKGDKFPIGPFIGGIQKFENHTIQLESGDTVYVFSDGYADQFGGEKGKKFRYKNFRELLLGMQDKEMYEQKELLDKTIESWRGELEQVDDILVIGIRV
jgi:serine phosphatase RsbU (regulator of sigma subunit)